MDAKYQLSYHTNNSVGKPRWMLSWQSPSLNDASEKLSCTLEIRFAYDTTPPSTFKRMVWIDGVAYELITHSEYEARCQVIRENEPSDKVADIIEQKLATEWLLTRTLNQEWMIVKEFADAERHWNAMLELNLFTPHVTV